VALLVYLPLSYASGMWMPVSELPEPVQVLAPFLPTYHLNALGHAAVGVPTADVAVHAAWLVGTFVVGTIVAAAAYRRVAGRQFA
jgi:ABC-2 type transport system permease protein